VLIRMSKWTTKEGLDQESRRLWEEGVRAVWKNQPGLIQAHLLAEPGTSNRMTFSVWASAEDYERFRNSQALRTVTEAYEDIYSTGGAPSPEEWKVLTEDWPALGQ
jgi:heme-degrading monooxygenase HmoA